MVSLFETRQRNQSLSETKKENVYALIKGKFDLVIDRLGYKLVLVKGDQFCVQGMNAGTS
jgi:hypothetical protein